MSGFGFGNVGFVGSLFSAPAPGPGLPAPAPLVVDQEDPAVRYNVPFNLYSTPNAYAGSLRYHNDLGDWAEITVPPAPSGTRGYTSCLWDGYSDPNGDAIDAYINGVRVGTGTQHVQAVQANAPYYNFTGIKAGDVLRITKAQFQNASSASSLIIDRMTFS